MGSAEAQTSGIYGFLLCWGLVLLSLRLVFRFIYWNQNRKKSNELSERARRKREERDAKKPKWIDNKPSYSVKQNEKMLAMSATEIAGAIKSGDLKAAHIMEMYIRRCYVLGRKTNNVAEEFYDEAMAAARKIDSMKPGQRKNSGKPLLGVPISIKDCIYQKDADSTKGVAARCYKPSEEDGIIVQIMREAGAIPFVRSNVPQACMTIETDNRIWGKAQNPWNFARTPGGSSGGEGSLIAMYCSPIGLGTDIGGSIRIPAAWCGIYGFKPTTKRLTEKGRVVCSGNLAVRSALGPMARDVDDLAALMKVLLCDAMYDQDPYIPRIPWRPELYTPEKRPTPPSGGKGKKQQQKKPKAPKRRIGVLTYDHWFTPTQACSAAVIHSVEALKEGNHEIVPFDGGVDGWEVIRLYLTIVGAPGNMHSIFKELDGEEPMPQYNEMRRHSDISNLIRPFADCWLQCNREERKRHMMRTQRDGGLSARAYQAAIVDLQKFRAAFWKRFREDGLDALILPAMPLPAIKHGMSKSLFCQCTYTMLANLLDAPAGVVPVRTTIRHIVKNQQGHLTPTNMDECFYDRQGREGNGAVHQRALPRREWDSIWRDAHLSMKDADQLPISVQVLTKPYEDETCLDIMRELRERLAGVEYGRMAKGEKFKIPVKVKIPGSWWAKHEPDKPKDSEAES